MNQRKKRNIIIGALCGVLLLMVVGYAAFSSVLNITGTSKISSNWDIAITSIEEKNIVGGAATATNATGDKKITGIGTLTASFETNLVSPGDSIEYDITVTNKGTVDAKLDKITLSEPNNEAIIFTTSGLTEGTLLSANNGTATLTVKVEYSNEVTSQPNKTMGTLTVTLDYIQDDGTGVIPSEPITSSDLIATAVTSGDGLYEDEYESGRYIYKGTNPNNYITFNNEIWRIISVEDDGTLKIIKKDRIGRMAFDSQGYRDSTSNGVGGTYCAQSSKGCNAWSVSDNFVNGTTSGTVLKDAEINTYLNVEYYNSLSSEAKNLIQEHQFSVGPVKSNNTDLAGQITSENGTIWNGKIGLMTASEILRANPNKEQCGNLSLNNTNSSNCKTTNYIVSAILDLWTITPYSNYAVSVFFVDGYGNLRTNGAGTTGTVDRANYGVFPVLYLTSEITLSGEGTSDNPYTIVSK